MEDDKILYGQFLSGDNIAFEKLVLRYKDSLICFIHRYIKDVHLCEDVAQEVFACIFVYKERYRGNASFKTYLFGVAKNKAVDHIRLLRRDMSIHEDAVYTQEDELFQRVVKKENQRLLHDCVGRLKPDYQAAIQLIDFEEMSYRDAAAVLGKTVPQIKILVYRARKALGVLLQKEGYTNEK